MPPADDELAAALAAIHLYRASQLSDSTSSRWVKSARQAQLRSWSPIQRNEVVRWFVYDTPY